MKKKVFRATFCLVWLVTLVITAEICVRTADLLRYDAPFFSNYSMDSLFMFDELGKYGRPNANFMKWHLNQLGYRGPNPRSNTYRIACIGSSETFGLYESEQNEWPRQLESILNASSTSHNYEVINVSFPGMSIPTTLKRLNQMLANVKPRLVVIYPSFTSYIEDDTPQPWPDQSTAQPKPIAERRHFDWRLTGLVETFLKENTPVAIQDWIRSLQVHFASRKANVIQRLPERNIIAFQTDLDHLVSTLQSDGIQVVLVTHATRFGTGPIAKEDLPLLTNWRKFYPKVEEQGLLDMESRMNSAMQSLGNDRNVPVVDAAHLIPPGKQNFAEFVHLSDSGARILATLVANQIQSENIPSGQVANLPSHAPAAGAIPPQLMAQPQ